MTGAPLPSGAQAVVPVEAQRRRGALGAAERGGRRPASTSGWPAATSGPVTRVLTAGTLLGPTQLALLAAVGRARVRVHAQPRVVVLSTGSELVDPGVTPGFGQVVDSNGIMLTAAAIDAGARPYRVGVVRDEAGTFLQTLTDQLVRADLVVTTGGVSAGAYDTVKEVLRGLGTVWFGKVAMQPGHAAGLRHGRPGRARRSSPCPATRSAPTCRSRCSSGRRSARWPGTGGCSGAARPRPRWRAGPRRRASCSWPAPSSAPTEDGSAGGPAVRRAGLARARRPGPGQRAGRGARGRHPGRGGRRGALPGAGPAGPMSEQPTGPTAAAADPRRRARRGADGRRVRQAGDRARGVGPRPGAAVRRPRWRRCATARCPRATRSRWPGSPGCRPPSSPRRWCRWRTRSPCTRWSSTSRSRDDGVEIAATVRTADRTGIEMEALTCVTVAALALVDMVKAVDKHARITDVRVTAKSGGRSGDWVEPGVRRRREGPGDHRVQPGRAGVYADRGGPILVAGPARARVSTSRTRSSSRTASRSSRRCARRSRTTWTSC